MAAGQVLGDQEVPRCTPTTAVALPHRRWDRNVGAQAVVTMLLTMAVVAGPWLLPTLIG